MSDSGSDAQTRALLSALNSSFEAGSCQDTLALSAALPELGGHDKTVGLCKSLQAKEYISLEQNEVTFWTLTEEGATYAAQGMPEFRLVEWMKLNPAEGGKSLDELRAALGAEADVALSNAMKLGWIRLDKQTKKAQVQPVASGEGFADSGRACLASVGKWQEEASRGDRNAENKLLSALKALEPSKQPDKLLQDFKKRKLVEVKKVKFFRIAKGPNFSLELKKTIADLTAKLLVNDAWKEAELKPYNFFARGKKLRCGSVHPLMVVQKQFKHVLTAMGFEEMETNQFVESSYWCFDSLFMPQQHPARDVQDTFFLKDPEQANIGRMPVDYVDRVKRVHEVGGYGSTGWQYEWSLQEALKNVMRTHTTCVSSRVLHQLAQEYKKNKVLPSRKLFSIDRVFRNETLDATHLAEFHQVEGMMVAPDLSIGHLMGMMVTFYKAIGIEQIKFKPAFNPYTEPSLEIFGYHPGLKKWIEVGNSGIFRPEMLLPMGLPENVGVIAWGLSLERPTMIKYGISNIRQLFGHKASLGIA